MKTHQIISTVGLLAMTTLGSAFAQQAPAPTQTTSSAQASMNPDNSGSYATGKPLATQGKEGFWGHVNPLARKKWVHRQLDPIKDRANELDQLQAKNANDIKDVDSRATTGIGKAMTAAQAADAHAADAATRADTANSVATTANGKTTALSGTVSNLDQYSQVSATDMTFTKGRTALTTKQKGDLDEVATSLATEKGYIVEVQGYSRAGVAPSQAMADSVVRYLVTAHQVPVYRIYRTGLGKTKKSADASATDVKPLANGVRVTVLHNSLATMGGATTGNAIVPSNPAAGSTGVSNPTSN
jgi:outer membrane protein OmpA-like peptidoglycan-associated protein